MYQTVLAKIDPLIAKEFPNQKWNTIFEAVQEAEHFEKEQRFVIATERWQAAAALVPEACERSNLQRIDKDTSNLIAKLNLIKGRKENVIDQV